MSTHDLGGALTAAVARMSRNAPGSGTGLAVSPRPRPMLKLTLTDLLARRVRP